MLGALLAVALLWLPGGRHRAAPLAGSAAQGRADGARTRDDRGLSPLRVAALPPPTTPPPSAPPLAPSLRGTDVDGALELDADGHFIATLAARRLFDYFLTTDGEVAPAAIRARIEAEARTRVPADEVAQVMVLYDRYVDYRDRLAASLASAPADRAAIIARTEALQRESFGEADAARLFGDDIKLSRQLLSYGSDPRP